MSNTTELATRLLHGLLQMASPLYDIWVRFVLDHQPVFEIITVVFIITAPFVVIWFFTVVLDFLISYVLRNRSNFLTIALSLCIADILVIGFFVFVTDGVAPVLIALPSLLFMPLVLSVRIYFSKMQERRAGSDLDYR